MRDILMDGLPIVDLLEITPSTSAVAQWSRCDQSSVSRIYRHVSGHLNLDFRKRGGHYRAHRNEGVLLALRQAAQLLRLSQGVGAVRWLGHPGNTSMCTQVGQGQLLPSDGLGEERSLELLDRRVIDLAVVRAPCRIGRWAAAGLLQPPRTGERQRATAGDLVVVAREFLEQPALQELIAAIRQGYRRAHGVLPTLRWL